MAELTGRAVSELTAATSLGDSDLFALSQGGSSKKLPASVLKASVLAAAIRNDLGNQTISASGDGTEINIVNTTNNAKVRVLASAEGGNLRLEKGLAHCEIDTSGMNASGTGYTRLYLNDGTSTELTKLFQFKQDGSFVDGNGISTTTLNTNIRAVSQYTYDNTMATFVETITGTNTRLFRKNKDIIVNYQGQVKTHAAGDTLFTFNTGYRSPFLFFVPFVTTTGGYGALSVNTNGEVKVSSIQGGTTAGAVLAHFSFLIA